MKSTYLRDKQLQQNCSYVAPIEKSMGLKWKTKATPESDLLMEHIKTFVVVPLVRMTNFSVPKIQWFFNVDEFDICCGLKSKATIPKIYAVYYRIRNMPIKYAPKLNNIYSAAQCSSINFKQTECGEDNVIDELRCELKVLERDGMNFDDLHLNVAVFDVVNDNLGANVTFGFAGSLSAEYFCRLCTCNKVETHTLTQEDISKRRSILLNELKHFHVISHMSIDIMHDICEGVIPCYLREFFLYCIRNKIYREQDLIHKTRDCHYGQKNSKNKPSRLNLERPNLGQNAIQTRCIMLHLPFIFSDKKQQLEVIWPIMISLLECMRAVFSYTVTENDISQFEQNKGRFLCGIVDIFRSKLKPKLHNLNHYAHVIRQMGPLRLMWMIWYECKHKFFTDAAKKN